MAAIESAGTDTDSQAQCTRHPLMSNAVYQLLCGMAAEKFRDTILLHKADGNIIARCGAIRIGVYSVAQLEECRLDVPDNGNVLSLKHIRRNVIRCRSRNKTYVLDLEELVTSLE